MKIIIPMAGMGTRLRPHTLNIPKPLLKVAGKPIVQKLVEDISRVTTEKIEEIAFVIGDFGKQVEAELLKIAAGVGARGRIYYQLEAQGTGHAVLCARESLEGKVVVAFADTLFKADFHLDDARDGVIWVSRVDDPSSFGVVTTDGPVITGFIEKPKTDVGTNLAIIGIYYFADGQFLRDELQYLIDNDIKGNGEYQITEALQNMMKKGCLFYTDHVEEWLDCGNKDATVYTNQRLLELNQGSLTVPDSVTIENTEIIPPCLIAGHVVLRNSKIGPHVTIGEHTMITDSVISNAIIQSNSKLRNASLTNSMIGSHVDYDGQGHQVSMGDYTTIK